VDQPCQMLDLTMDDGNRSFGRACEQLRSKATTESQRHEDSGFFVLPCFRGAFPHRLFIRVRAARPHRETDAQQSLATQGVARFIGFLGRALERILLVWPAQFRNREKCRSDRQRGILSVGGQYTHNRPSRGRAPLRGKLMESALQRLRGEFLEMPGLQLTFRQIQRFCGIEECECKAALDALVRAKFLCLKRDGTYARWSDISALAHSTEIERAGN
jgi:hypothetical protein